MNDYSQHGEGKIISDYFNGKTGHLLDIGANDGKTLSNTLHLIESGWSGLLIEPSSQAFSRLEKLHGENKNITLLNVAVSEKDETVDFFESGSHLKNGDVALLSTIKESEIDRWKGTEEFTKTKTECLTFESIQSLVGDKKYNLISIDAEGLDYEILSQIDLDKVGCEMLVVEHNSVETEKYITYAEKFGMKVYHTNFCNLIFVR